MITTDSAIQMYTPADFQIENRDELIHFMRENLFVTIVSNSADGIIATRNDEKEFIRVC